MTMLKIDRLSVSALGSPIISNFSLDIAAGTLHVLMGPNGSGKSTLAYALAGHPRYEVEAQELLFLGQDLTALSPDKRAKLGFFLAPQNPPEIPGVTVEHFLRETYAACTGHTISVKDFQILVEHAMAALAIDPSFLRRSLHENFSGGEKKRLELLQLLLLKPKLAILDELDSGLDIDALATVCTVLAQFKKDNPQTALILITHNPRLAHQLIPDFIHLIHQGTVLRSGNSSLAQELEQKGYDGIIRR